MKDKDNEFLRAVEALYRENGLRVPSLYRALLARSCHDLGTWQLIDDMEVVRRYAQWCARDYAGRRILAFAESVDLERCAAVVVEDENCEPGSIVVLHTVREERPKGKEVDDTLKSFDEWAAEVLSELAWWYNEYTHKYKRRDQ